MHVIPTKGIVSGKHGLALATIFRNGGIAPVAADITHVFRAYDPTQTLVYVDVLPYCDLNGATLQEATLSIVTQPTGASVIISTSRSGVDRIQVVIHDQSDYGTFTIGYQVEVGGVLSEVGQLIVDRQFVPFAVYDAVTVNANKSSNIAVLSNDVDYDSQNIQVTIRDYPANGTATVNENNEIVYTPNNGFVGVDVVRYRLTDDDGNNSSDTSVDITVVNPVWDDSGVWNDNEIWSE